MTYTLGLDIGTSSIGWAVVPDEPVEGAANIVAGVRVFPEGVEREKSGTEKSKSMARREARGMRRQHERKARRKRKLGSVLRRAALLPETREEVTASSSTSVYMLRKRGLDQDLSLHEFGRVLLHLGQRRGFKSNRKEDGKEDGVVYAGISEVRSGMEESGARTLGEYLAGLDEQERIRGRYTSRDLYLSEFELLWERQHRAHPETLTPALKARIQDSIFFQRPLKSSEEKIGDCDLEKGEKRCPKASWFAQEFRLLKEVNDLKISDLAGDERQLTVEQRRKLLEALHSEKNIPIDSLRKTLGLLEEEHLNFQLGKQPKMLGNTAEAALRKALKKRFESDPTLFREQVFESLIKDDQDVFAQRADTEWGMSDEEIAALFKEASPVPKGYLRYSRKVIQKMLPFLQEGFGEYEAKGMAGYLESKEAVQAVSSLPLPDSLLPNLTNPIVKKALFEVRKVVNAIVREYGKPSKILVELARDTKGSAEERNNQLKENRDREKERDRIRALLRDQGVSDPKGADILKYRLAEECNWKCPYTDRSISFHQLFGPTPEVQIEHILPFSRCLDDSQANKTLCFVDENIRKGNRTPQEAYSADPAAWEALLVRIKDLPYRKQRKFQQKEIDLDKCISRQLNDTRYINTQVREYLAVLGVPVNVTRGQVTAELRWQWGLDSILNPNRDYKNRDDHRHHAIDAVVIALTTQGHLQSLARKEEYKREEKKFEPWEGFRNQVAAAVEGIHVSYRPTRKISGALHEDTNYGPTEKPGVFVYRKPLEALTPAMVEKIRDAKVRKLVSQRLEEYQGDTKKAFHRDNKLFMPNKNGVPIPIRKVRILSEASGMVPMKGGDGKPYRYVAPGSNHHISIFEYEVKGKKKREGVVTTMFEAAKIAMENGKRRRMNLPDLPIIRQVHPTKPDAKFVMALAKNDMVTLSVDGGPEELCRLQKFSVGAAPDLNFRLHTASKIDEPGTLRRITSLNPGKVQIQKVTVDPLGRISLAHD
jgi:CRISPR-associated endonuclease Csn1